MSYYYDKDRGGYVFEVPQADGTKKLVDMDSPQWDSYETAAKRDEKRFQQQHGYSRFKDYSKDHGRLFGADNADLGSSLYYGGSGSNWQYALDDRARNRVNPYGLWNNEGFYENGSRTIDPASRALMMRRNNAIEDLARRGYSQQQLRAHLDGQRNILQEEPDWADYQMYKDKGVSGNWFIDAPSDVRSGGSAPAQRQQKPEPQVLPHEKEGNAAYGLFSPENFQMRNFISQHLKSRLFGG